jgi:hypothetical protein
MKDFSMDYKKSVIKFQKQKPNILMQFFDFQMDLETNFNLSTTPFFYSDIGEGKFSFLFDNMTIGLGIAQKDGVFSIQPDKVTAHYSKGLTYFNGTGDLSFALNAATSFIEDQMRKNANQTLASFVGLGVGAFNSAITKSGCNAKMSGIFINW